MPPRAHVLLDRAWEALDAGHTARAVGLARRASRDKGAAGEVAHLIGVAHLDEGRPELALESFERSLAADGPIADLLYDTGLAHEQLGHERRRREVFLQVLDIDARDERGEAAPWLDENRLVAVAEEVLDELPDAIRDRLANVPIIVEPRPARYLVEEGLDPRSLGLFEGTPWSEQGASGPAPARIVLYSSCIAAACRAPGEATDQARITLLHETAHFFGLDEEEVARLGLA